MNIITSVSPITDIYILKGVPLDPSYSDTIDFENKEAQETYFKSKKKYNWSECSPCSMQNTIGIPVVADKVYDCNYIMFKNANFSNKWFYAFITNIEYININSCKLSFSIDVLQTWMFDYSWRRCLVEREHANDDSIGANLVEEGLNLGDYVREDLKAFEGVFGIDTTKNYTFAIGNNTYSVPPVSIVAGCSFKYDFSTKSITDEIETKYRYGQYSGLNFYAFTSSSSFDDFINTATSSGKIDGVMCCYSFPTALLTTAVTPDTTLPPMQPASFALSGSRRPTTVGNYTPKNKKLLTFPYTSLEINTTDGDISEHRFEYLIGSENTNMNFEYGISILNSGEVIVIPVYYYGGSGDGDIRYDKAIGLSNFPMVGWVSDTYRAYIAQNASSLNYQYKAIQADFNYNKTMGMVNAANSYVGGLLGGVPGAVNSAINASQAAPATPAPATQVAPTGTGMAGFGMALANVLPSAVSAGTNYAMSMVGNAYNMKKAQMSFKAAMEDYDRKPNTAHGATAANARISSGFWGFKFYNKHIREDYAKIIDDYFSMYGYKTMKVKVPNTTGRAEWNYVKVNKASIIPNSVAASDIDMIKSIFENGVTIWHNPSNVGRYNLDNSIVS